MNDDIAPDDGPISTQPTGNPDLGVPGDSPLADAPEPEAPTLEPDSTEPAADAGDGDGADAPLEEAGPANNDLVLDVALADSLPPEAATEPAREARRLSRGEREIYERTRQRFAACGRCGYLMADFQILLGEEALQEAAIRARDGWLRLEGDEALRPLLVSAFGIRLDLGYDYMDGACPECGRRFVFAALDEGQVRLKLRT